jgi:hypothetical protein
MDAVCWRCGDVTLERAPAKRSGGRETFSCPRCRRQYARAPGKDLTDHWRSVISLVLYPVMFEPEPSQHADRVARMLLRSKSQDELPRIIAEIRDELTRPQQRVSDILDTQAKEPELRIYLTCVVDSLEAVLRDPGATPRIQPTSDSGPATGSK